MTTIEQTTPKAVWLSTPVDVAAELGVHPEHGLGAGEVERRLSQYGPNELPKESPPSRWMVARGQLSNPMNIMLMIVAVLSFVVGQIPTGIFVLGLVTFNVVMASSQELKARASVAALAQLQGAARPRAPRGRR
jgi:P-type Ca2+ transporter type 2C